MLRNISQKYLLRTKSKVYSSCKSVAPDLKQLRMDDFGAIMSPIERIVHLLRTKNMRWFWAG